MIYLTPCSPGKKVTYSARWAMSGISWHTCSPGKKVTYSHHDIPEQDVRYIMERISYFFASVCPGEKSNFFARWALSWSTFLPMIYIMVSLLTWQKSNLFSPWYTWQKRHDITPCSPGKKVLTWLPDTTWLIPWYTCSPGKKVTYSHHDIPDILLTWQKSNLFSPWYTWHPAHLAKKLLILTMIYLTPCSPGKKVTYSHHDIWHPAHLAKKYTPWYTWHTAHLAKK